MSYTFPITKDMACARSMLPISEKYAHFIAKNINQKPYPKAKKIVEGMATETISLKGKYYTKASKHMLSLLDALETNAKAKNLAIEKLKLYIAVHRGPTLYRMRRKNMYGKRMRVCNVQVVLRSGKNGAGKEIRK